MGARADGDAETDVADVIVDTEVETAAPSITPMRPDRFDAAAWPSAPPAAGTRAESEYFVDRAGLGSTSAVAHAQHFSAFKERQRHAERAEVVHLHEQGGAALGSGQ